MIRFSTVSVCVLCLMVMWSSTPVNAQVIADTAFLTTASANKIKAYKDFITVYSGLYNGSEYRQPQQMKEEHAFFVSEDWQSGDVVYNGEHYENVPFLYDLTSDNLITENYNNGQEIQLVKSKISRFSIEGRNFVSFDVSENPGLPQSGFYEVLYDGPTKVLVRHVKVYEEKIEQNKIVIYYTPKNRNYIYLKGSYQRISRKGDLLKLFGEKKNLVRSYMRQHDIKISKHNPRSFASLAAYFDTLTNPE